MPDDLPLFAPLTTTTGTMQVTRADVVAEARSWIGTPYKHQHRTKGSLGGVDCVGLIIGVARELELVAKDFDFNGYARTPDGTSMIEICDRFMDRVAVSAVQPGDVLVYEFERNLGPQHMGILGDYLYGGLSLIQALGTSDGKGDVREWNIVRPRKGWRAVQGYALRGVA